MAIKLFLDSGAFGIYNKLSKSSKDGSAMSSLKGRRLDDYSYTKSNDYKEYRKQYAYFLKNNKKHFSIYANLDVIGNAELTYKNQKWFEKYGLNPCPVWHITSDVKWLQRYVDEGYSYICIGAMVGVSSRIRQEVLDTIWAENLTDSIGMPLVKVHGFGMTSFKLMSRYPWYSVDSKSWIDHARFGCIVYPTRKQGEFDWSQPTTILVSHRKFKSVPSQHFKTQQGYLRKYILGYLKSIGIPFGKSLFRKVDPDYKPVTGKEFWYTKGKEIEIIKEAGVSNSQVCRLDANLYAYTKFEFQLPKWPSSLYSLGFDRKKRLL